MPYSTNSQMRSPLLAIVGGFDVQQAKLMLAVPFLNTLGGVRLKKRSEAKTQIMENKLIKYELNFTDARNSVQC